MEDIRGVVLDQKLSLSKAHKTFDEKGNLKDAKTKELLKEIASQLILFPQALGPIGVKEN